MVSKTKYYTSKAKSDVRYYTEYDVIGYKDISKKLSIFQIYNSDKLELISFEKGCFPTFFCARADFVFNDEFALYSSVLIDYNKIWEEING